MDRELDRTLNLAVEVDVERAAVAPEMLSRTPENGEPLFSPSPAVLSSELPLPAQYGSTLRIIESSCEMRLTQSE
jgi:hypothetical protein